MDNNKKAAIDALEEAKGIVSEAWRSVGLARSTFYKWCTDDPEFKAAVADIQEVAIDYVEGKLFSLIENGDTAGTIFYLKTKGKHRGYVEKTEIAAEVNLNKSPSWFDDGNP
jgi:hypothetical protein